MITHPDSVSVIAIFPGDKPGVCNWHHWLLVPHLPQSAEEKKHYDKSVALLDGVTYVQEDFWISEQIQKGLNAGAIDELTLGINESMIKTFCDNLETELG